MLYGVIPGIVWAEGLLIGAETMRLTNTIKLSKIHPSFEDVSSKHSTSFFVLFSLSSFFRIGGEGFSMEVSSDKTNMLVNGGGALLDFIFGETFVVFGGTLLGGVSVMTTHEVASTTEENVDEGFFYSQGGFLTMPYLGSGISFESGEMGILISQWILDSSVAQLDVFNSTYVGLRGGIRF